MPAYTRRHVPEGTYFFTVVMANRRRLLSSDVLRSILGAAMREVRARWTFETLAIVLLHDHLHCLWRLPHGDQDYSRRWSVIKRLVSQRWFEREGSTPPVSVSRARHREHGIWQRRFWEHTIRDEADFIRHVEYIHWNPVKHGLASCPHAWPHSSFERWTCGAGYGPEWMCRCGGRDVSPPDFSMLDETAME
jgi:putative transposase